jgi:hypothetical protein
MPEIISDGRLKIDNGFLIADRGFSISKKINQQSKIPGMTSRYDESQQVFLPFPCFSSILLLYAFLLGSLVD